MVTRVCAHTVAAIGQCSTIWKALWAQSVAYRGLSFVWWRALKCWAEEKKKKTEKETINNLIVIRVLEPKPKTDLYQRKYYADHFFTHIQYTR